MARMVAIGQERLTLPFGAVGFEMVEARPADFLEALRRALGDRSVGLVVCGESFAAGVKEQFAELCGGARAAVLVVPDGPEAQGTGREIVRSAVDVAAGVDLLGSIESGGSLAGPEEKQKTGTEDGR